MSGRLKLNDHEYYRDSKSPSLRGIKCDTVLTNGSTAGIYSGTLYIKHIQGGSVVKTKTEQWKAIGSGGVFYIAHTYRNDMSGNTDNSLEDSWQFHFEDFRKLTNTKISGAHYPSYVGNYIMNCFEATNGYPYVVNSFFVDEQLKFNSSLSSGDDLVFSSNLHSGGYPMSSYKVPSKFVVFCRT